MAIRSFGFTMKHFTKQNCPPMQPAWKIGGIQINNTVNTSNEKKMNIFFLKKKPFASKHSPPSNVYYMELYCNFLS